MGEYQKEYDQQNTNNYPEQNPGGLNLEPVMTIGQWLIISIVMAIPCVNIVMLFVWGFGNGNQNRANYCKAALILWIIGVVVSFLLMGVLGVAGVAQN